MSIIERQITVYGADQIGLQFFLRRNVDTVKAVRGESKSYFHLFDGNVETYVSRDALRQALCRESRGAWVEEKEGKSRYFIDKSTWWKTSFLEVCEDQVEREADSTLQKVLGIGVGALSLASGFFGLFRSLPGGSVECSASLILQRENPFLSGILCSGILTYPIGAQALLNESQINIYSVNRQQEPCVASLEDGGFIVTWDSFGQDLDVFGVYGRRYDAFGFPISTEYLVNSNTQRSQQNSSVTGLSDGGFVVIWQSDGQDSSEFGVYGQRYDVSGSPQGGEFQVNTEQISFQQNASVCSLRDGGFVVVWESWNQDGSDFGIFGQRYNDLGTFNGLEFSVNSYTSSNQTNPKVVGLNTGGYAVVWQSEDQDGHKLGVFGRTFDTLGVPSPEEFRVNNYTLDIQENPSLASMHGGGFVVVWQSFEQDGDSYGIFGKRYDVGGNPLGPEFQVNTFIRYNQSNPDIAGLTDGGFVVVWQSETQDGDGYGIYGQQYSASGVAVNTEFRVNEAVNGNQENPSIAGLAGGSFIVVWQSIEGQDIEVEIFGRQFDPLGNVTTTTTTSFYPIQTSLQSSSTLPSTSQREKTSSSAFSTTLAPWNFTSTSENSSLSTVSMTLPVTTYLTQNSSSILVSTFGASSSVYSAVSNPIPTLFLSEIIYGENYSVMLNGQSIGTFDFTGGVGSIDPNGSNTITIHLDSDYFPLEGDSIVLFNISSSSDEAIFEGVQIEVEGGNTDCLEAHGERSGTSYIIIFELANSCATGGGSLLPSMSAYFLA